MDASKESGAKASRVVRSGWFVDTWLARPPTTDEVRPERCPGCGLRHGEDGCRLHGHGWRDRTMLGPVAPEGPPEQRAVPVRRYRCTACRCVLVVVPRELTARRRYWLPAIAAALALWSLDALTGGAVRRRIAPNPAAGFAEPRVWPSLRRWVRERAGLWPDLSVAPRATDRKTAAALVVALVARGPRAPPLPTVADVWAAAPG